MCPFSIWGFDLIDQFNLPLYRGHTFIIITVKYFIKWVEAIPMTSTKCPKIFEFIEHNIINQFGIPMRIVLDNDPNFKNKDM